MGIQTNGLRFLLLARAIGANFEKTATLGRQWLSTNFTEAHTVLASEWKTGIDDATLRSLLGSGYIDDLVRQLGADDVHSFDYSSYEGATHVHDFNRPIDPSAYGKYSVVMDGGSLEHVFNFPVAIENCMRMLRVGGHFLGLTPTNNYMGHGFYQFSPELYFRIFSPENGFRVEHILLVQGAQTPRWFRVTDPETTKKRFGIEDSERSMLYVLATKVADVEPFTTAPLQSDYQAVWQTDPERVPAVSAAGRNVEKWLPRWLPGPMRESLDRYQANRLRLKRQRKARKKFLTPFDATQGERGIRALTEASRRA